jgi:hypothetical protein
VVGCRKYRATKAGSDDESGPSVAPADDKLPPPPAGGPPPIKEEDTVTRERQIGKGALIYNSSATASLPVGKDPSGACFRKQTAV